MTEWVTPIRSSQSNGTHPRKSKARPMSPGWNSHELCLDVSVRWSNPSAGYSEEQREDEEIPVR